MLARLVVLVFLIACGGTRGGAKAPKQKRGLEAAALPYSIVDARTGRQVERAAFWTAVMSSRVVCVGENHPNPHHHWFQLEVMTEVAARRPAKVALGMEMFQ